MKTTISDNINTCFLPDLQKKTNITSITISVVLLVFAASIFYLSHIKQSDIITSTEIFLGVVAICVAIFLLGWQRTKLINKETGSVVSKDHIFYNPVDFYGIKAALEEENFEAFAGFRRQQEGNVQTVFYFSADHKYIAIQVFKYEPFEYKPQTDIYVFKDVAAMKLIEKIK